MIERILNWAVPLVCGSVVTYCVTWWRMQRKKNTALEEGVQCLLRGEILRNYKEYSRKGYCPNYAKEAENRAYNAYHALGGNDIATDKHDYIMALPEKGGKIKWGTKSLWKNARKSWHSITTHTRTEI